MGSAELRKNYKPVQVITDRPLIEVKKSDQVLLVGRTWPRSSTAGEPRPCVGGDLDEDAYEFARRLELARRAEAVPCGARRRRAELQMQGRPRRS